MTQTIPSTGDIFEQRYELLEALGSGGIGTVFKARQIDADRLVALKVLHPHIVVDEEFKLRFLREAQALGKLSHINIVTVYHMGISETGLPYLVMEMINGHSLRRSLSEGKPIPPLRVFKIMKQLCSALACIHQAGIVHRDLKPENIVLLNYPDPDSVKIIDFGLAKVNTEPGEQKLTSTGILVGSINYMSPEQCQGKKADARSDIYALTICMYEMLAGEPPFTADSPIGLMYKHANAQAPDLRLQTGQLVNPAIAEFVRKGLEKDPVRRFQTAEGMEEELSKLVEIFGGDSIARSRINSRVIVILAVLATLLLAGGALRLGSSRQKSAQPPVMTATASGSGTGDAYVQQVMARRGLDSGKVRDLLDFRTRHKFSPTALAAARAARKIASGLSKEHRSLLYEAELCAGQDAYELNMPAEAIDLLHRLISMDEHQPPFGVSAQTILQAKGMAADAYLKMGNKEAALAMAEQLVDWKSGLPGDGAVPALNVLVTGNKTAPARSLVEQVHGFNAIIHCLRICLAARQFDLCHLCLERAGHSLLTPNLDMRARLDDSIRLEYWRGVVYLEEKDFSKARQVMERTYNNPDYHEIIFEGTGEHAFSLALLMRKAGLLREALELVDRVPENYSGKKLLHADLLVMKERFREARRLLNSHVIIVDPETTRPRTALRRLDDIESKKADYRKGLNQFEF